MAKNESNHRHKLDDAVVKIEGDKIKSDAFTQRLGMICALVFGLAVIGCGIFLITKGHTTEGVGLTGAMLTAIMLAFLKGK